MSEFFAMDGYGAYIWPPYILTLIVVTGITLIRRGRLKRAREADRRHSVGE